jgi:ribosomal protein S18 acetylase RimI-like enzyme
MINRINNINEWENTFDLLALYSDGYRKKRISNLMNSNIRYYKYTINDKIVGVIGYIKSSNNIVHITVHPDYRNKHIAISMINSILDEFIYAYLSVRKNNSIMNNLITKHYKYQILTTTRNSFNEELYYYLIKKMD